MGRKIEPALVLLIDKKLKNNVAAQAAIKQRNPRNLFIQVMKAFVGIREKGGNNTGYEVKLLQETIGEAVGEPWCMSTVQSALAYCEIKIGIISPVAAGEHCLTVWNTTPKSLRVKTVPGPGAIIIWQHGTSTNGHTGMVVSYKGSTMRCIEGNTEKGLRPDGSIQREGGGVYETERNTKANGEMKVVGFLKPF